jgi:pimeloyl-ACP methyl ester carboxylesterase
MLTSSFHPFRSELAKKRYLEYYNRREHEWPNQYEDNQINTSYGMTNVRISGSKGKQPLLLLPGYYANSLLWINNISALSTFYCTYAVDNIYDIGLSVYTRKPKSPNDYVLWLNEVITALNIHERVNILGISFGGWLAIKYALRHSDRISKLVLMAPASILPLCIAFYIRGGIGKLNQQLFRSFFYWLFEDAGKSKNESIRKEMKESVEEILLGMECYQRKFELPPSVITDSELISILLPTLFIIGEHEKIYSAERAVDRLKRVAPQIKISLVPNAGHDLLLSQTELVNEIVLNFLKRENNR